jgi:cyclophilin family peptidyl-prolyl cis-trans isomerase
MNVLRLLTILAATATIAAAATIGPEVAVMEIQFGKDKDTQQVIIGLYDSDAPGTVANFKELCAKKFYNNMRFHRVFPGTLVQTGDPNSRHGDTIRSGTGGPGYTIPAEIRLPHVRGSVAMSRLDTKVNPAKASSGSQFYVALAPLPKLNNEYTVFGEIIEGLDVLDFISNQPTDSNDFPLPKIIIKSITIQPRFAESAR